jgi:ABC-type phosphate/phosphonate transport system ATPase subunit
LLVAYAIVYVTSAVLQGLKKKAKVEGSLIRLFKAKEESRSMRVLAYLNILRLANPASLA